MTQEQILWLVIGLVVLIVLIAIIAAVVGRNRRRQREADHASAEQLRADAARQHNRVAVETESAESARLEAEAAEADARRLREEAQERERVARESQQSLDDQLRTADRLDPEVQTDRDGRRKDGSDPRETLTGAGAAAGAGTVGAHRDADHDGVADVREHHHHDDGHAPQAAGTGQDMAQDQFRPVGEASAEEHQVVERRMAADPADEPSNAVAAEAGRTDWGVDGTRQQDEQLTAEHRTEDADGQHGTDERLTGGRHEQHDAGQHSGLHRAEHQGQHEQHGQHSGLHRAEDGEQVVYPEEKQLDPEWDQFGDGTRPPRG